MIENEASKVYEESPWAAGKWAAEIVRPAPVQWADNVPSKSLARDMVFAKLQSRIWPQRRRYKQRSYTAQCLRHNRLSCLVRAHLALAHAQVTDRACTECAMEDGHGATARRKRQMCEESLAAHPFHPFCCKYGEAKTRPHRAVVKAH